MPSDKIRVPIGPDTRARAKKMQEELQELVQEVQSQEIVPKVIEGLERVGLKVIHVVQVKEDHDWPLPSSSISLAIYLVNLESCLVISI